MFGVERDMAASSFQENWATVVLYYSKLYTCAPEASK